MPGNHNSHRRPIGSAGALPHHSAPAIRGLWRCALMIAMVAQLSLSACAIPERLFAVPKSLTTKAQVSDLPNILFC